ncbi:peptidase M50 [Fervidobacterium riparium]|nr:peptidase M50 [Fervidobacterium riparium]
MKELFLSVTKNLLYGLIAYVLISLPREILRCLFYNFLTPKESRKTLPSLNPFRYIDPVGIFAFIFFNFGWTRAPFIDFTKMRKKKLFTYASFGILSSFVLAFLYGFLARIANPVFFDVLYRASLWSFTYGLISILPVPPLDGSRLLLAFLPTKSYEWYIKFNVYGIIFMLGLLVLWILPLIMQPLVIFITTVTNYIVFGNW